jgi:hypothetical protein
MVGYPSDSIYQNKMTERFHLGGYDIDVHRASPMPCPVCGHPTGDCTGEDGPEPPDHISGYNSIESLNETQTYLIEEEVTERRQIAGDIWITVIKHAKGSRISLEAAKNLGLI